MFTSRAPLNSRSRQTVPILYSLARYTIYQLGNMQEGWRWGSLPVGLATTGSAQYALPGLISPSSTQPSLYGPLAERPEALPPRVPSPEGEMGLTAATRQRLMMPPQRVQKDIATAARAAAPCRCCTLAMLNAEVHIFSGTESV